MSLAHRMTVSRADCPASSKGPSIRGPLNFGESQYQRFWPADITPMSIDGTASSHCYGRSRDARNCWRERVKLSNCPWKTAGFCSARVGKIRQIQKVSSPRVRRRKAAVSPLVFLHSETGQMPFIALSSDSFPRKKSVSRAILPLRIGQIQMEFILFLATEWLRSQLKRYGTRAKSRLHEIGVFLEW